MTVDGNAGGLTENLIAVIEAAGGTRPASKSLQELWQAVAVALAAFNPGIAVGTIEPGAHITVDATDPTHPVVAAVDFVESITGSTSITVDNTDPLNPIIKRPAITGDAGIPANSNTITFEDVNTDVGTFGDATHVAVVTVNAKGLITAVEAVEITGGGGGGIDSVVGSTSITVDDTDPANPIVERAAITGDAGIPANSNTLTFEDVNTDVGTFGDDTHVAVVTVNAKGLITAVEAVAISGGGGGAVDSVVAGTNVTIDDTDPANPIVNASGVLESVVAGTNVTIDDTDPANPIINATGGGGSSPVTVATFAFDHTMSTDLLAGMDSGITIPAGSIVRLIGISQPIVWNENTEFNPGCSVGTSAQTSQWGELLNSVNLANTWDSSGNGTSDGTGGQGVSALASSFNSYIFTEEVNLFVCLGSGTNAQFFPEGGVPQTGFVIASGVNDEFVYTPAATGTPETFTIAAGTYPDLQTSLNAVLAAIGSAHGEAFGTLVGIYNQAGAFTPYLMEAGSIHNGDTITPGTHDATATIGWTGNPDTFSGGADAGNDPGSTSGSSVLIVEYITP